MAQGYTLQQLQQMGAKPVQPTGGLTLDQLKAQQFPKQVPPEVHKSFFDKLANFGQGAQDLAVGAAKGAVSTVKGASDLGQKIFDPITNAITGTKSQGQNSSIIPQSTYTPKNTAEKIGKGIEQTAELFTPTGVETSGANLLTKIAAGASEFGVKTAIQTGGDKKQTAIAAATGGAGELASAGISKLLEKVPENAWSAILKRTPTQVAKNPNLPAQAAETGLMGTRHQIMTQAENHIQQLETGLDDILKNSKKTISGQEVAQYLNGLKESYQNIPGEIGSVTTIDGIAKEVAAKETLTPLEANQMKRDIYGLIAKSYGKGTLESPAKTEAQKQIARGLKTEIEKVIPEAKTLNDKQAVYIQINKALNKLSQRTEGKGIAGTGIGLYDLITGAGTEALGLATGHPLLGVGAVAAKKTAESAPVLSGAAKLAKYFDDLSPTKKLLFQKAIQGLSVKGTTSVGK